MGIISSTEQKPESSDHKAQNKQVHSETVGDSSGNDWGERSEAFFKGGACREAYMDFNNCLHEGTCLCMRKLKTCMEAHSDYYQPYFTVYNAAEKAAVESALSFMPSNLVDKEEAEKFIEAFMEGGGCKESYNAYNNDCIDEVEKNRKEEDSAAEDHYSKCAGLFDKLFKCFEANSDYYHPIFTAMKTAEEVMVNEAKAFFSKST